MAPTAKASVELLQAIAVTAELTSTELSEGAARVMVSDLGAYPLGQVLGALVRCRRELKGKLTIAAVLERLDDGRPGQDEAWAMIPTDESGSVVWTDEMAAAYGVAAALLSHGDRIAARMAFRDAYSRNVALARADQRPVRWTPSLGRDIRGHEAALDEAVQKNRLSPDHVARLIPPRDTTNVLMLESARPAIPAHVRNQLAAFVAKVKRTP